jgi:hypothetical protein
MRRALWLALIMLAQTVVPQIALGAEPAEEIAKQYAAAMAAEDWARAMALVRPADLKMIAGALRDVLLHPVSGKKVRRDLGEPSKEPKLMSEAEITGYVFSRAYAKYRELGLLGAEKMQISLLGSATENADTVHFVQKSEYRDANKPLKEISVISVVRESGSWYVLFPQSLRNQATSFTEQLKQAAEHADMDSNP